MFKGARTSVVVALLVMAAGFVIAACGSSNATNASASASASTATTGTSTTPGARAGGFFSNLTATQKSCLKSKGVTIPTGGFGGGRRFGGGTGTTGNFTPPTGTNGNFTPPSGGGTPPGGTSTTGGFPGAGTRPGGAGGGFTGANSKFATAFKACGIKTTGFAGRFAGGAGGGKPSTTAITAFVSCVNKNGYTLKASDVNTSGTGSVLPKSLETNQKFLAAAKSCTQYLRSAPPSGTTTTASTS